MWLEKIRLRRQLASNDATVRIRAIASLDATNDLAILRELASADNDTAVQPSQRG